VKSYDEVRYKIRALTHCMGAQGDMLVALRDNIKTCIEQHPEDKELKECLLILDEMTEITKNTNKKMKKLQKTYKEYNNK
jgi:hypothetical protein